MIMNKTKVVKQGKDKVLQWDQMRLVFVFSNECGLGYHYQKVKERVPRYFMVKNWTTPTSPP